MGRVGHALPCLKGLLHHREQLMGYLYVNPAGKTTPAKAGFGEHIVQWMDSKTESLCDAVNRMKEVETLLETSFPWEHCRRISKGDGLAVSKGKFVVFPSIGKGPGH